MKIKTKLVLGIGLLFILITLLGAVGIVYINALKQDTENILTANYNTVLYARNMLTALEDGSENAMHNFETHLLSQENNITEPGEDEATAEVRKHFESFKLNPGDHMAEKEIREGILHIMEMNMQAIQRKSEVAESAAGNAVIWISITAGLCFIIALTLLINLPSHIANPVKKLTESIRQIAAKNYSERVHFESHSEFGELAKSFNTMAEKLEEYNNSNLAKLMMEKKRVETLINNMQDPVIGLDKNLKVIFVNQEAVRITGMEEDNLLGYNARELAEKNDLIRTLTRDLVTPENENTTATAPIKIFCNNKEGHFEKEILHIFLTPTGEHIQKLAGHFIILRNVTEYKELDSAKTHFIATVSHEFKTPISSIKMSLQLLENQEIGTLNEEQKHLLESINEDASRLLKITGELLNMTQVESGNIQLSVLPASPKEILSYAIQANRVQADQKQIRFEINYPEDIPDILADSEKTAWVLTNLISNAIRYSYDNSTIYLAIRKTGKKVQFLVQDTGQGIAPQYKDKIFERYFRIPGTQKEGTGLGLAISKEFIEAQGGHISVDSEFGAGSIFTVTLNSLS